MAASIYMKPHREAPIKLQAVIAEYHSTQIPFVANLPESYSYHPPQESRKDTKYPHRMRRFAATSFWKQSKNIANSIKLLASNYATKISVQVSDGIGYGALFLLLSGPSVNAEVIKPLARESQSNPEYLVTILAEMKSDIEKNAKPISLDQAISLGITNNPQLQSAFNTIQQFEWQLISAQRQWYPTLQLQNGIPFAGVTLEKYTVNTLSGSGGSGSASLDNTTSTQTFRSSILAPGVTLNWNVIDPTRQPDINAASSALRQQKLLFDTSARELILEIQQTYFKMQSTRQLIENFQRIYNINKKQLDMTMAQRQIRMSTVLDVELTRSQLFIQLSQLEQYTRNYIQQSAKLAALLSLENNQLVVPAEEATLVGSWPLSLDQTLQKAIANREEIQASLAAAESAEWTGIAAIRTYLPSFQLVASISSSLYSNTSFPDSTTSSAGLGFTWSIFDGGIEAATAQSSFAQAKQQKNLAANAVLQVEQQVRSSYGDYLSSQVAVHSARQALSSAEQAHAAAKVRFAVGVGDITSVVQTIQQLSQSAQLLSESILSYNTAVSQLYRSSAIWPSTTQLQVNELIKQLRKSRH